MEESGQEDCRWCNSVDSRRRSGGVMGQKGQKGSRRVSS